MKNFICESCLEMDKRNLRATKYHWRPKTVICPPLDEINAETSGLWSIFSVFFVVYIFFKCCSWEFGRRAVKCDVVGLLIYKILFIFEFN